MSSIPVINNEVPETRGIFQQLHETINYLLEGNKKKNTIKVLDSVRAIAIISVVLFHVSSAANLKQAHWIDRRIIAVIFAGNAGVTLFFVLSGFLLSLPYIKSLLFDGDWPSIKQFYLRRALRILPGYYLALFLLVILSQPVYLQPDHWKQLFLFLIFFMDSSKSTWQLLNGPFWTLAVEWQFYMVLPLLALLVRPIVQRGSLTRRLWVLLGCLGVLIGWGMFSRYIGYYFINQHPDQTFGLPHSVFSAILAVPYGCCDYGGNGKYLEEFAVGIVVAVCYMMARNSPFEGRWNTILRSLSPWLFIGGILSLLLMALWNAKYYGDFPSTASEQAALFLNKIFFEVFHELGLAIGYGSFTLAILFAGRFITRVFEWDLFRWVGLISYSVYIWHNPILISFNNAIGSSVQNWSVFRVWCLLLVWMILVAIPFSFVYFVLVERPFMKFSERLRKKPVVTREKQLFEPEVTL